MSDFTFACDYPKEMCVQCLSKRQHEEQDKHDRTALFSDPFFAEGDGSF